MAVLVDSVVPVYSIGMSVFDSVELPSGYPADIKVFQTDLIYTNQPIPTVIFQQKSGPESVRQLWS